jgi:hypothetical protein
LDRRPDEPVGPLARDRLQPEAGAVGEADLGVFLGEVLPKQRGELGVGLAASLELDSGVQVLGVLAEDDHVDILRAADGRGDAFDVADRPQADVKVERLAQGDVQRADPSPDRSGQRALDADHELSKGGDRFVRSQD